MGRFDECDDLADELDGTGGSLGTLDRPRASATCPDELVLDIDSSVNPTYGGQEGTGYNGHFACTCYHPLFVFN
jgi:hypothetical protein